VDHAHRLAAIATGICLTLSPNALAQGGKGGYAKITPLAGTMEIQVNNDGNAYSVIDRPITVSFRAQGAAGKRREMKAWKVTVGEWERNIRKADIYTQTVSLKDVYKTRELTGRCEQLLEFEAASQKKTPHQLRNSGWTKTFQYSLPYQTVMRVDNPYTPKFESLYREDTDSQNIIIRCLGHKADPRPNKKPSESAETKPPRQTRAAPPRDGSAPERAPRQTIKVGGIEEVSMKKTDDVANSVIGKVDAVLPPSQSGPTEYSTAPTGGGLPLLSYIVGGFGTSPDGPFVFMRLENAGAAKTEAGRIRFTLENRSGEKERVSVLVPELSPGDVFTAEGSTALAKESYVSAIAELPTTSVQYDLFAEDIIERSKTREAGLNLVTD